MSTLWTPDGERPIRREGQADPSPAASSPGPDAGAGPSAEDQQAAAEQMAEMTERLARTPAEVVVANHAFGMFELAALHLSQQPPQLDQARTAIDALAALVEGMVGRLGEPEEQLKEGLSQLRMAFVQISSAESAGGDAGGE